MLIKARRALAAALFVLACFFSVDISANGQVLELQVRDAIALAEENNLNFRLVQIDWDAARAQLERAVIVGEAEMLEEAEKAWLKAEQHYQEQRENLYNLVRTKYQHLLEKEAAMASVFKAKERAENQLTIDGKKYEAGLLSSLDIQRAENSLFEAKHRYEMALIDLETARMQFNELLGLPFEQQVVLTERLLLDFIPFTLDLDTCVELALIHDQSLAAARENLEEARDTVLAAQSPFTPQAELEKALAEKEKAQIRLEQAEQALYFNIRAAYYALLDQAHDLEVFELQLELERNTLLAEESKYAAGMLSNAQIVAQQETLAKLEESYSKALLNYSLARLELLRTIGETDGEGIDGHE